jgi:hypothetical protein
VITGSEPSRTAPFTGRPWSLPLEDRVLPVAAYRRTNLTLRRLHPGTGPHAKGQAEPLGWKILRGCRLEADGVHRAMLGIARPRSPALTG